MSKFKEIWADSQSTEGGHMSKAKELADKLKSLCVAEFAWPYLNDAATELRQLAAIEQAITDPENQPSQYGTITLDEHEKKVSAITEKYSDAVDRFVKEREKVFALEQAAEPVAAPAGHFFVNDYGRWEESSSGVGTPLYTHPAPRKPMTKKQIDEVRNALTFDIEDTPEPWAFREGVRAAERFHDIKE
jgi:hypothetical protein